MTELSRVGSSGIKPIIHILEGVTINKLLLSFGYIIMGESAENVRKTAVAPRVSAKSYFGPPIVYSNFLSKSFFILMDVLFFDRLG